MTKGDTLGALQLTARPASNTPCKHTPLKNAWCSACGDKGKNRRTVTTTK